MSALATPRQRARPRDGSKGSESEQRRRKNENKREKTYDSAHGERQDLMQADEAIEERDLRRLPRRLFERLLGIGVRPVLVVALRRQVDVEAV